MGMKTYAGKTVFGGIAIGKIRIEGKGKTIVKRCRIENVEEEIKRYHDAMKKASDQLKKIHEKAVSEVGEVNAQIFEVHMMMIEDDDYVESVENIIRTQNMNAEYAVASTGDNFAKLFSGMEDEYFRARADDIRDISDRLLKILADSNEKDSGETMVEEEKSSDNTTLLTEKQEPVILAAQELTPSETVQMDKSILLGFVTQYGSVNSHTAILARTMNIPAITGIEPRPDWHGKMAVVDGFGGELIIEPDEKTLLQYQERLKQLKEEEEQAKKLIGLENITKSGKKIKVYANIANVSDLYSVLHNDVEGIGLFRSEFLYMEGSTLPDEEKQFAAYKQVAQTMGGKKVIIRTMDIGADKKLSYLDLGEEENPAMGYRAIRISIKQPELFKTQLRAIYRASLYGNVSIMYPMITSLWELDKIMEIEKEVQDELKEAGIEWKKMERGIMIETPAAAIISDKLAEKVDFFSIGTNDLVQYTLAVDRQNGNIGDFYNPHHEAVLRLIQTVIRNGHAQGIWVGICGEMASDLELTDLFLDMGIDELSVAPVFNLAIRKKVREHE
ncbi:MAG: phosphoenolpyruvate--protein phosphotransferase [Thermoflexaceae bacterium]|nr:phosphoenolpyruvate--protein phosphotransferase [Thermoflexaceae bacterium]